MAPINNSGKSTPMKKKHVVMISKQKTIREKVRERNLRKRKKHHKRSQLANNKKNVKSLFSITKEGKPEPNPKIKTENNFNTPIMVEVP